MYRLLPLVLMLAACDHECADDTDAGTDTDVGVDSDNDSTDTDTDTDAVDYPDYPSESGGNTWVGVVWTDSDDGPLGDVTYIGSPREVGFDAGEVYSQTDELVTDQAELTWNFVIPDGALGEHYIDGDGMYVYSSDDFSTNLNFTGWVRVDTFDANAEMLRMVFVGEVSGSTGTSNVSGAVDIAPGAE